jgi:hypothetical protein
MQTAKNQNHCWRNSAAMTTAPPSALTITLYEINPTPGVRVAKIKSLENDIALSLSAPGTRVTGLILGRGNIDSMDYSYNVRNRSYKKPKLKFS